MKIKLKPNSQIGLNYEVNKIIKKFISFIANNVN